MTADRLDPSQEAATRVSAGARQVIEAGPGSGKTEVVAALVEHLLTDEGVDPVAGVLVISFSHAALHAVDARLRAAGCQPVAVRTIDSLASEITHDHLEDGDIARDFDGRIAQATAILEAEGWDRLAEMDHVIVDEIQDVVGVRADFIASLLRHLPAESGFTVLGDAAQGIYDFQIRHQPDQPPPASTTTSEEILASLLSEHRARQSRLTGRYRAKSRETNAAANLRDAMLAGRGLVAVDMFYADVTHFGTVSDVARMLDGWEGATAFLTDTNGQAMLVARELADADIIVELRRASHERVLASWLGAILGTVTAASVSRAEFESRVAELVLDLDVGEAWRALRRVGGSRGSDVDLSTLARQLRRSVPVPPILLTAPAGRVVVSTVHRAKGLEFENVVLVDFPGSRMGADCFDPGEETRKKFVALTRASSRLIRATGPDDRSLRQMSVPLKRWYRGGFQSWQTFGIEIRPGDIGPITDEDVQTHLASWIDAGDPLRFEFDPERSSRTLPRYTVLHGERPVGRTTEQFGEALGARIRPTRGGAHRWPVPTAARLATVGTAVPDSATAPTHHRRFALYPVCTGLLDLDWKGTTSS